MPRPRPVALSALLAALLFLGVMGAPARAQALSFDLQLGSTRLEQPGGADWLPSLRASLGFGMLGPLELGAYVHLHAQSWSFGHRASGGGALLALRPSLPGIPLRLLLEGSVGRAILPVDQRTARAWATAVAGGLAVDLHSTFALEARATRSWHHRVQDAPVGDAWTFSLGFTIRLF